MVEASQACSPGMLGARDAAFERDRMQEGRLEEFCLQAIEFISCRPGLSPHLSQRLTGGVRHLSILICDE